MTVKSGLNFRKNQNSRRELEIVGLELQIASFPVKIFTTFLFQNDPLARTATLLGQLQWFDEVSFC
jgi:hypothetical protein